MTLTKHTKLKQFLDNSGLQAKELFELLEREAKLTDSTPVHQYQISNFVNGKADMTVVSILKMCKILKCTPNDIINYEHVLD